MDFPIQFRMGGNYAKKLDRIAAGEKYLTEKWILGQKKNKKYKQEKPGDKITRMDTEFLALAGWILPDVRYKYKQITQAEMCKTKEYKIFRSSIIPVVNIGGINHWLLGSFHDYDNTDNPILSDFAGRCEQEDLNENCPVTACALRELNEETKGLLLKPVLEAMENKRNVVVFEGTNEERKEKVYFMFVSLKYDDVANIPYLFFQTDMLDKSKEKLGPLGFYKQSDVKSFKYRTAKNLTDFLFYLNMRHF